MIVDHDHRMLTSEVLAPLLRRALSLIGEAIFVVGSASQEQMSTHIALLAHRGWHTLYVLYAGDPAFVMEVEAYVRTQLSAAMLGRCHSSSMVGLGRDGAAPYMLYLAVGNSERY